MSGPTSGISHYSFNLIELTSKPVSREGWAKWGSTLSRFQQDGPGVQGGQALVKHANSSLPFSKASGIMDIGCGSGSVVRELIAAYGPEIPKEARIIAADLSPGMIEQVRQRQSQDTAWAKVELAIYDAMDLSAVPDGSLSHVLSGFTIFLLPDHRKGMSEALRILETGGILAFTSMAQSTWTELMGKISEVRPEKKVPGPGPMWKTEDGVKGELEAAGFKDVQAYSASLYIPFEDHMEIVDYLMSTLPFMPMFTKDMTAEEISRSRDLMIQHVKEEYPTLPGKLPGLAIIGIGKKG